MGCFASDLDPLARPPLHAHGDRGTVKDGSLFQGYTIAQSVTGAHGSSFAAPVFGVATVVNRANGGGLVAGSEFLCTQIVFRDRNHPIVRGMWLLSWRDAGRYLTRLMPPRSKDPFGGKLAIVAKGWADYVPLALFEPSLLVRLPGSTATDPTGGDSNMVDVAGLIRLIPNRCLQFTIFAPGITIPNVMKQLDLEETGHFGQVLYKQVLQQAVPQGVTNFANTRVVLTGVALSEVMSLNTESDWTSDGGHREVIRVELSDNADVNRVLGGKDGWEIPPTKFTPTGKIKLVAAQHNGFLLTCGADNAVDLKGPNYLEYDLETKVLTLQISLAYFSRGQTFKRGYNLIGNPPSDKHDYDMIQRKWRKTTDFSNTIAEVRQRYS